MKFYKRAARQGLPKPTEVPNGSCCLQEVQWNDYWYWSSFMAYLFIDGEVKALGELKIVSLNQKSTDTLSNNVPQEFETLGEQEDTFCSAGQSDSYYEELKELPQNLRDSYLDALRDIVFNERYQDSLANCLSFRNSLMRELTREKLDKFHEILTGAPIQEAFDFSFAVARGSKISDGDAFIHVMVEPGDLPPTNIHVITGRNGVGKSSTIFKLSEDVIRLSIKDGSEGTAEREELNRTADSSQTGYSPEQIKGLRQFSNLVVVAYSIFDNFGKVSQELINRSGIRYHYLGFKSDESGKKDTSAAQPNTEVSRAQSTRDTDKNRGGTIFSQISRISRSGKDLTGGATTDRTANHQHELPGMELMAEDCYRSFVTSCFSLRRKRLDRALHHLCNDPGFAALELHKYTQDQPESISPDVLKERFNTLSSGHRMVLYTLIKLVEYTDDRTLVILDEPESHLHPPLLASFIAALSELLTTRNAVAVIATHSPVVLQEVPRRCVSIIEANDGSTRVRRPRLETYGENAGLLTYEVFGLELMQSGFYRQLRTLAEKYGYEDTLKILHQRLGSEGKVILRYLAETRDHA